VVAVTKGFGPEAVRSALDAGIGDIGENYAQELIAKQEALGPAEHIRWHFLGHIQRNKVARLSPLVDCWQSVARITEGEAIARTGGRGPVLVEVETTGLPGRNGCSPEEVGSLVRRLDELGLGVHGLMTVAPPDPLAARRSFATVRALADDHGLPERSMGMSDDLEAAVREGSTMVRIGRALFGARPAAGLHDPT